MAEVDIKEVKTKVAKGLEVARWNLLEKHPFIGEMLLRFSIIPTYDKNCLTAATDGSKIYFDCEFYSNLTKGQREFVLAHEVWHNIFLHFIRRQMRDQMLWNVATDMEINHMLQNEGLEVLKDCCFPDPIVAGKNAEDIYAYLKKHQQKQQKKNGKGQGDDQSQGSGEGDQDGDSPDGQGDSSSSSNSKGGKQKGNQNGQGQNNGNNKGQYGNQFDKHIYEGDGSGNADKQDGKFGKRGNDPDFNPSMKDAKETENKIKEMVTSVAQSIERKQGHLPAGVASYVEKMLKPEINWKEALSQFICKVLGGEHTWSRVSRHALARGHYLPGRMEERITVAVGLDTSGSCTQDLPKFLGELNGLLNSFGKYEVTLIQCDAEIQDVQKYDDANPIDLTKEFEAKGFGGTDARPIFKWIRESGEEYNAIIVMTDGYTTAPTYSVGIPTLWVLTADGCDNFCDWGEKMRFKPEHKEF